MTTHFGWRWPVAAAAAETVAESLYLSSVQWGIVQIAINCLIKHSPMEEKKF